ncbi:MAG TPA: GntR family transcriptional regulator [Clostridia bacterium]|nr:GntR family transcriptional regulator [Clostridia bacterium]
MALYQDSAMPLYQQLKEDLKQKIESGRLKVGQKISSELEICSLYQISRVTVRKAISELVAEGYLVKNPGKGTFVSKQKIKRKIEYLMSFSEACEANGMIPSACVTERKILQPNRDLYEGLQLEPNDQILYIQRVRYADGQPMMCENNYYPYSRFSFLMEEELNGSLYQLLEDKYGIQVAYSKNSYLEIARASNTIAKLMNVANREPLFLMYTEVCDSHDRIVHVGKQYMLEDRYRFYIIDYPRVPKE